jgi:hypothetical protein
MGEMSKLGWLIGWPTRDMWVDSLYLLYAVFGSICKTFASFQHILWPSSYACWANFDGHMCYASCVWSFFNVLMSVLTLADGLCCAWFMYPILCWCWYLEVGNRSINWAQLSRFHLKTDTESSLWNVVLNKNRMMDNFQKHNKYINIPSSQSFRSY